MVFWVAFRIHGHDTVARFETVHAVGVVAELDEAGGVRIVHLAPCEVAVIRVGAVTAFGGVLGETCHGVDTEFGVVFLGNVQAVVDVVEVAVVEGEDDWFGGEFATAVDPVDYFAHVNRGVAGVAVGTEVAFELGWGDRVFAGFGFEDFVIHDYGQVTGAFVGREGGGNGG